MKINLEKRLEDQKDYNKTSSIWTLGVSESDKKEAEVFFNCFKKQWTSCFQIWQQT
jgi:hypothetical protein